VSMANGLSPYASQQRSSPLHNTSIPKAFGVPSVTLKSHGSGFSQAGDLSALQKYKVKRLVGLRPTMPIIRYENPKSNQQKSCICSCTYSDCRSTCSDGGSLGFHRSIAARCCSEECSPAAINSILLHSGGFRRIACPAQFASGCETVDLSTRHIDRSARTRT